MVAAESVWKRLCVQRWTVRLSHFCTCEVSPPFSFRPYVGYVAFCGPKEMLEARRYCTRTRVCTRTHTLAKEPRRGGTPRGGSARVLPSRPCFGLVAYTLGHSSSQDRGFLRGVSCEGHEGALQPALPPWLQCAQNRIPVEKGPRDSHMAGVWA